MAALFIIRKNLYQNYFFAFLPQLSIHISIWFYPSSLINFNCSINSFKINPWFNGYFKFLMWMTYLVLSCKLVTSFPTFSIFILSGKSDKSFRSLCKFLEYWTSTSRKYPSSLSSLYFYRKFSLNWEVSSIHSNLFTGSFCNIAQPYKLFKCQYLSYDDSLF